MGQLSYNTAAREAIIGFMSENPDRQFKAEEIFREIIKKQNGEKKTGKSTVYRLLSKLCDEEILRRYREDNDMSYLYQYIEKDKGCSGHLHMKCSGCGRVYHLECGMSEELLSHVMSDHGFQVDAAVSMLYGECSACNQKNKKGI